MVNEAAPKWKILGLALLPYKQHLDIDNIEVDHPGDVVRCCECVLERWLEFDPNATWNQLIRALKVGGLHHLANHLKQRITESEII